MRALLDLAAALSRKAGDLRGRGALGYRLGSALGMRVGGEWLIPMRNGCRMRVPRASMQTWAAAFTGRYDDEELARLGGFVEPGAFVLDVGACFGFYAVPLAVAAKAAGARVVAFEPVLANVGVLTANLALNDVADVVRVVPVGLGRAAAEAQMTTEKSGVGNAAMAPAGGPAAGEATSLVRVERLDDVRLPEEDGSRRCSLIKIDVEGSELDVLEGAERFIARHRPAVFGEFSPWWMERRGVEPDAAQRWAAAHGYRCYQLVRTRRSWLRDSLAPSLAELSVEAPRSGSDLLLVPGETRPGPAVRDWL